LICLFCITVFPPVVVLFCGRDLFALVFVPPFATQRKTLKGNAVVTNMLVRQSELRTPKLNAIWFFVKLVFPGIVCVSGNP